MDDTIEQDILGRMLMSPMEEGLFGLEGTVAADVVIAPLRMRETCPKCYQIFRHDHHRLWHQFIHVPAYDGFLDGVPLGKLPPFNFCVPCPHSTCNLKFVDFIDAKIHYMLDHQCCQLFCCGEKFPNYLKALEHLAAAKRFEPEGTWPKPGHCVNLQPLFMCSCCSQFWSSRHEFTAHLQGRHHLCPDPLCKLFFEDNERCIRHFFEYHYKHLVLDGRHILLNYKQFVKYQEKQEERCNGGYHCAACHRRFHHHKTLQKHQDAGGCVTNDRKFFTPIIPCKCNHQFVYCYHQRDVLLRHIPVLKEALEHIEREAPYNSMPDDVCKIYRTILIVISDVHERLVNEKYTNYQRTNSSKHSSFTQKQMAKILLGAVDYFVKIM